MTQHACWSEACLARDSDKINSKGIPDEIPHLIKPLQKNRVTPKPLPQNLDKSNGNIVAEHKTTRALLNKLKNSPVPDNKKINSENSPSTLVDMTNSAPITTPNKIEPTANNSQNGLVINDRIGLDPAELSNEGNTTVTGMDDATTMVGYAAIGAALLYQQCLLVNTMAVMAQQHYQQSLSATNVTANEGEGDKNEGTTPTCPNRSSLEQNDITPYHEDGNTTNMSQKRIGDGSVTGMVNKTCAWQHHRSPYSYKEGVGDNINNAFSSPMGFYGDFEENQNDAPIPYVAPAQFVYGIT